MSKNKTDVEVLVSGAKKLGGVIKNQAKSLIEGGMNPTKARRRSGIKRAAERVFGN